MSPDTSSTPILDDWRKSLFGDAEFWYQHIAEDEAARFVHLSTRRMQGLRQEGKGPKFVRISGRCVRYRRIDLRKWAEAMLRSSTST